MWGSRQLLLVGFALHVLYLLSIFDIYFRTPLVHGMLPVRPKHVTPPAKRLVLFVADGLRADYAFVDTTAGEGRPDMGHRLPFLRKVILEQGRWGVSHTRVPTESRPGHVALIAGFYEDPSAVTKGWKHNPVDFDSLFNRTAPTFGFGSPDILSMFHGPGYRPHSYAPEMEDFASSDLSQLDVWVFDEFKALLEEAATNATLDALLRAPETVFFFHYLGIDSNGHVYDPPSREYVGNIQVVDRLVQKTVELMEAFFRLDDEDDGKGGSSTAFVFTADHGMSDRGNHGDGDPANTRTPLIVWGAGVAPPHRFSESDEQRDSGNMAADIVGRGGGGGGGGAHSDDVAAAVDRRRRSTRSHPPLPSLSESGPAATHHGVKGGTGASPGEQEGQAGKSHHSRSSIAAGPGGGVSLAFTAQQQAEVLNDERNDHPEWGLDDFERNDVAQADVTALMASLIGIDFPLNSIGVVPTAYLHGSSDPAFISRSLQANAEQITSQLCRKAFLKEESALLFRPYTPLPCATAIPHTMAQVERLISKRQYAEADSLSYALALTAVGGLRYFQTYDWLFLMTAVVSGYTGWVALLLHHVAHDAAGSGDGVQGSSNGNGGSVGWNRAALCVFSISSLWLALERSPPLYYVYVAAPLYLWASVAGQQRVGLGGGGTVGGMGLTAASGVFVMGNIQIMVFGYIERRAFAGCFLSLAGWGLFGGWKWGIVPLDGGPDVHGGDPYALVAEDAPHVPTLSLRLSWFALNLIIAAFSTLPLDLKDNTTIYWAGAGVVLAVGVAGVCSVWAQVGLPTKVALVAQTALVPLSAVVVGRITSSLAQKNGLSSAMQCCSCTIMVLSPCVPAVVNWCAKGGGSDRLTVQLLQTFLALASPLTVLSVTYEVAFFGVMGAALYCWAGMERRLSRLNGERMNRNERHRRQEEATGGGQCGRGVSKDSRRESEEKHDRCYMTVTEQARFALFFLLFIHAAFFCTGNIASVGSFRISSVLRLLTTFSPFTMGALLVLKVIMPFIMVLSALHVATHVCRVPALRVFLLAEALFDIMAINFFFMVTDSGSWLDIGSSISRFVISNAFILVLALLFWAVRATISLSAHPDDIKRGGGRGGDWLLQDAVAAGTKKVA